MIQPQKIFSAQQIREADRFTIQHEPVASADLMERAAQKCAAWIQQHFTAGNKFHIFCGHGNNGGDGLAIARLLLLSGYDVQVYIVNMPGKYAEDFLVNESLLRELKDHALKKINTAADIPELLPTDIIVDAVFGTGLSREVTGLAAQCIAAINISGASVVSVDIPSGLFADVTSVHSSAIVKATYTLSFQFPKLAFFFPENAVYAGTWEILDIGLSKQFMAGEPAAHYIITAELIKSILRPRNKFSHKGTFGHALLVAGSYGKIGAAVLAVRSCLRSGTGLVTVQLPKCGYEIMQRTNPESMVLADTNEQLISDTVSIKAYSAVGIGPGMGTEEMTQKVVHRLLKNSEQPLVLDADALNSIGLHKEWLRHIPPNSILTPHPKEFERLTGKSADDFERHHLQISFSKTCKLFVILKGAHTCITTPDGDSYFNTTGNPGMAKGGSGDVLTGIVTGILAQGYPPLETCLTSVYIHGLAGDLARDAIGEMGMTAGDLCDFVPAAFKQFIS